MQISCLRADNPRLLPLSQQAAGPQKSYDRMSDSMHLTCPVFFSTIHHAEYSTIDRPVAISLPQTGSQEGADGRPRREAIR
jgi:hypothetical protein